MNANNRLLATICLLSVCTPALAQTNFVRITNSAPINAISNGCGVGWADYDNDGYLDLFVANYAGNNCLLHNQGNGTFALVTTGDIVNEGAFESYGVAWGDYNNDGFPDLFVANGYDSGKTSFLYRNNGDGTFTRITNGSVVSVSGHFTGCAWADFDRDGFIDLFVPNDNNPGSAGTSLLFHNNGDGTFTRSNSAVSANSYAIGGAWADYNNDGWPDLLVANGWGSADTLSFLYKNVGNGKFTRVAAPSFDSPSRTSISVAWGDYDNDGFPDIFVVNDGAPNELYHNNGNGTFTRITSGAIVTDMAVGIAAAWGDYDNDGWLDLFVGNRNPGDGGPARGFLYHNNGNGTFTRITTGAIAEFANSAGGVAWGDYDNDGFLDLFISDLRSTANGLFHNTGNANHWIKVKCVGVASNRMAIGAKVRVRATINGRPLWQVREITTGDGFGNGALVAHFGLGDATNLDTVRIEWPSGQTQEIGGLTADQSLQVFEPPTLRATGMDADGFHLLVQTSRASTQHRVESSPDLQAWTEVRTVTSQAVGQFVPVVDPTALNRSLRFYRVVWLDKGYTR